MLFIIYSFYFLHIEIEILHFSDASNLEEKQAYSQEKEREYKWGGAARFKKAFDMYRSKEKLVLFTGDFFFPSKCKII